MEGHLLVRGEASLGVYLSDRCLPPISRGLKLWGLYVVISLEFQASETLQIEPGTLGLLLEPCAQGRLNAGDDLVRYSLFHRRPLGG